MKKIYTTIVAIIAIVHISYGQWSTGSGTIYPTTLTDKVGIGTMTPGAKLDVNGAIANNRNWYYLAGAGDTNHAIGNVGGDGEQFRFFNFFDLYQASSGASRLYINSIGNIGVGNTNPGDKLVVTGAIRSNVGGTTGYGSYGGGYVAYDQDNGGNHLFSLTRQTNNLGISSFDGIGFAVNTNSPSNVYQMFINNAGQVGIGTTTPHEALSVNGDIRSRKVTVTSTNWPDYVFNKEYKLPSLLEVKTYIDKNQHLPDVPSEQEILKDGLNLGEMNKLLLKKVEELTLYLIEKDNADKIKEQKLQSQQQQLDQLKQQIADLVKSLKKQ